MKRMGMVLLGLLALLYLLNPTLGIFELIPDNIPLIGNIDEGLAAAILLGVLRSFGLDLTRGFKRERNLNP